jgi:hypothetical protein
MKQVETKTKELYEAPAMLDISPATVTRGIGPVESLEGEPNIVVDEEEEG